MEEATRKPKGSWKPAGGGMGQDSPMSLQPVCGPGKQGNGRKPDFHQEPV